MEAPLQVAFTGVTADDFEELVALRIAAMRESLERVGRFDPERARQRLRNSFHPEWTEFIVVEGKRVGFHTFCPGDGCFHLDHLYIHPSCQGQGIGSLVMRHLLARSDARQMPVRLGALRESPSNRFYQRHGFVQTDEDEWDIYYVRAASAEASPDPMTDHATSLGDAETVVQRQLEAYNAHDLDALMATYAEGARLYEHPANLLAAGAAQFRERFAARFEEPNLHAKLLKRIVMGRFVVDHELVTRTFPEGAGTVELIATYQVEGGKIINAWFLAGPKTLGSA